VSEKPSFRRLVPSRRCLVLLDGFYEWHKARRPPLIALRACARAHAWTIIMRGRTQLFWQERRHRERGAALPCVQPVGSRPEPALPHGLALP
jgi:hypothetical protein